MFSLISIAFALAARLSFHLRTTLAFPISPLHWPELPQIMAGNFTCALRMVCGGLALAEYIGRPDSILVLSAFTREEGYV
jgi:hypothetical protein